MPHQDDAGIIENTHNLARFFTENRHISWVLLVAVFLWGFYGYDNMPKRKDPNIPISIASVVGSMGNPGQTNYGAAKAGIAAFSIIAAQELVKYGVTVNCLAPTAWSRMTAPLFGGDEAPDSLREQISPRWIAVVSAWLASPEAGNVTGRVFDIRGDQFDTTTSFLSGSAID